MNESASKNWGGGRYVKFCLEASMEDETFNTFKQSPNYTKILEHVTEEQGTAYLSHCKDFILNNNLQFTTTLWVPPNYTSTQTLALYLLLH